MDYRPKATKRFEFESERTARRDYIARVSRNPKLADELVPRVVIDKIHKGNKPWIDPTVN